MVVLDEDEYFAHYGILRRSGRYPWGTEGWGDGSERDWSVEESYLGYIDEMKRQGLTETEIARGVGITTTQLRAARSIAKNRVKQEQIRMAEKLSAKGYSNVAAAERMGIPESTYRTLLKPGAKAKADALTSTSEMLKRTVEEKEFVDVGAGVENHIHVSKTRLNNALAILKEEGYEIHKVKILQQGTGLETEVKVLTKPGVTQKETWLNRGKIKHVTEFSTDNGLNFTRPEDFKPLPVDPNRVAVRYAEEGGSEADGVIYVRPGVEDLTLGKNRYAQVRVLVGEDRFLKGMAMYKDDLPEGVDLVFNTNKSDTGDPRDAMKEISSDPDLPFESITRPMLDRPAQDPEAKVISAMNIVNEEGDWTTWKRNLSSQVLSKQPPSLAKEQLEMTYEARQEELDQILELTNPVVRKKLLETFADGTDSAAVHLHAAALERQNWSVILPVESINPGEIYAPNYRNGEKVALIRYPHGGIFEIPELRVNNKHAESKKLLGNARDAVGIHHTVAERLSGADFDGDTVLVIPNDKGQVTHSKPLKELANFDPIREYPAYEGMPKLSSDHKQRLMGDVSNLITDMTIKQAPHNEIARAVKHSMVVIDAEKHNLNYKQSAIDNGIANLKEKYQGGKRSGASTLISLATSPEHVNDYKPRPMKEGGPVDPKTGAKVYVPSGKTRTARDGTKVPRKRPTAKLALTDDANTLSSGTPIERIYATHSNKLKKLANKARLEALDAPNLKLSPSAKKHYSSELASLKKKLAHANSNKPLERQAQIIAGENIKARRKANPNLGGDTLKKLRYRALEDARDRVGAKKKQIEIEPKEWDAIQNGAVSTSMLNQILDNTDIDEVRKLATPRPERLMTSAKTARAQQMLASGYTRAEVADKLGVSVTTLDVATSGIFEEG